MTDRELLEAAAKAAGKPAPMMQDDSKGLSWGNGWWNPLTDDGDALRLAVRLQMAVSVCTDYTVMLGCETRENHRTDPLAATRRAITRAAAEIGRTMK
jgi:hypothetical protein